MFKPALRTLIGIIIGVFSLTGCASPEARPLVLISAPPSGTVVEANTEVLVRATATDTAGVARIELWANGTLVAAETNPAVVAGNFSAILRWTPRLPGNYTLEARAVSFTNQISAPATITVVAQAASVRPTLVPTPSPLPTVTATATISPITLTPTLTSAPPPLTPPTPSPTIPPTITPTPTATMIPPTPVAPATEAPAPQSPTVPAAPPAPTGLSATTTGQTTVDLTWADNAGDEEGFRIYRSLSGTDALVGQRTARAGTGNTTHTVTGLTCSETYTLYIKAYKGGAESALSNTATVSTDPCTPTNVVAPSHTGQTVTVTWNDNSTTPEETGFKIYFGNTLKKIVAAHAGVGAQSTTVTGLDCSTTYSDIRVSAIYGTRESPKSASAGNETTAPCQVRVEFTRVDIKNDTDTDFFDPGEIRLTFNVEGQARYYPSSSGNEKIHTGANKTFNVAYNLTLNRTDTLNISVHAQDVDDDPDDMGTVTINYAGTLPTNFGSGAHTLENAFFKIYFTITVTAPP